MLAKNNMRQRYRTDIQILRGLAVLAVILNHAAKNYFPNGYLGVDAFFTISGFVVTPLVIRIFNGNFSNKREVYYNLLSFYKGRVNRLAPALLVTLISSAILIFFLGPISDHQRFARQGIATILLLGNLGALRYAGDYFSPNPNPLIHTWSLSLEEQIYFALPIIFFCTLLIVKDVKKTSKLLFFLITVISLTTICFPELVNNILKSWNIDAFSEIAFYSPLARVWQFSIGSFGYLLIENRQGFSYRIKRAFNLFFVALLILLLFGSLSINREVNSTLTSLITLLLILFKSIDELPSFLQKVWKLVGDRSYSIYLVHLPLFYILDLSPFSPFQNTENSFLKAVFYIFISMLLGSLMYLKVENALRPRNNHDRKSEIQVKHVAIAFLIPLTIFLGIDRFATRSLGLDQNLPVGGSVLPWDWDKNCKFVSSPEHVINKPCKYGNFEPTKSILLIGDSHAAAASRAIVELGKSNSMNTFVYTFQGCGFVLDSENFDPAYTYPFLSQSCIEHNKSIINFVELYKPTTIIWIHRSSSIMVEPNNYNSRKQYNYMIYQSLLELRTLNPNIIVVGSNPEYVDPNTIAQKMFGIEKIQYSKIPFEDNYLWKLLSKDNFFYLDTLEIFCPGKICSNKSESGWLFQDRDHLSELGAKLLIPGLDLLLKEISK